MLGFAALRVFGLQDCNRREISMFDFSPPGLL